MPKLEVALPDEDLLKRGRRAGGGVGNDATPWSAAPQDMSAASGGPSPSCRRKNGDSGASGLATGTGDWGSSPATWRRFAKRHTCTQCSGPTRTLARRSGCSSLSGRVGTSPTGRSKGPSGGRSPAAARWQRPYSCRHQPRTIRRLPRTSDVRAGTGKTRGGTVPPPPTEASDSVRE
jgi:hypothetical protein